MLCAGLLLHRQRTYWSAVAAVRRCDPLASSVGNLISGKSETGHRGYDFPVEWLPGPIRRVRSSWRYFRQKSKPFVPRSHNSESPSDDHRETREQSVWPDVRVRQAENKPVLSE